MDKKKIIIVIAVVIVLYLVYKSSSSASTSKDQKDASGTIGDLTNSLASSVSTLATATNVNKSVEDEYYQDLLAEYRRVNGGSLPRGATSLTASQLEKEIATLKKLNEAINDYYEIEDDEVQMTADQLKAKGIDTLEEVTTLIAEVKTRKKNEYLDDLLERFRLTCTQVVSNLWNPAGARRFPWDESLLQEIMNLSVSDTKALNAKFVKRKEEFNYPDNFSALNYRFRIRTSLSDAIPTGTLWHYRPGKDKADAFRKEMQNRGC